MLTRRDMNKINEITIFVLNKMAFLNNFLHSFLKYFVRCLPSLITTVIDVTVLHDKNYKEL